MVSRAPEVVTVPLRVFVADDDDELRTLVVDTLRADGCTVVEARDGAALLALLEDAFEDPSTRPDLIVSDACMPHLSGLGVLEAMKRAHISVPMLIMTGFVPPSVGVVARRLGGLGVLSKPFDVNALRIAVARAAAGNSTW